MTLLFLNDSMNIDLFADDSTTCIHQAGYSSSEIERKLQLDINCIDSWCRTNNMLLHPNKSKCMIIGTANKTRETSGLQLTINGTVLENVYVHKLLGVYIDNNLKWHHQIDDVCKRVNSKIYLLKNVLYYLSDEMKQMFYNAYILPIMDYCCQIWGKGNTSYINKIYSQQKRIAKIILRKPKRSSSSGLLKDLGWLTFTDRCKYQTAVLVYKIRNNMMPSYMAELIDFSYDKPYTLRSVTNHDLAMHCLPKTNYLKYSFTYFSMNVWNQIPVLIRESKKVSYFKNKYKSFLLKHMD